MSMLHVGLTGNIAVGKSCVSARFTELGAFVIDADHVAHELFDYGTPTYKRVVEAFGHDIIHENGTINRTTLGDIVFTSEEKRLLLNSIVHPAVHEAISQKIAERETTTPDGIIIVDAALLVETGRHGEYDRLIVIACDAAQQLERLMSRDHLSEKAAKARIAAQMPMMEKIRLADYVIDTSGTFDSTRKQVENVYRKLLQFSSNIS